MPDTVTVTVRESFPKFKDVAGESSVAMRLAFVILTATRYTDMVNASSPLISRSVVKRRHLLTMACTNQNSLKQGI